MEQMKIKCTVVEMREGKNKRHAKLRFRLGESKLSAVRHGWGWCADDVTVGEVIELSLEEFAKMEFGEGTNEKGTYKTFSMGF